MKLPPFLAELPRMGWVSSPSPVEAFPSLQRSMGLEWFGVKRDDLLPGLHGGTKLRKLDLLLASEPWKSAEEWASLGAIGSGHLATMAEAAQACERKLLAHTFWTPPSLPGLHNLATLTHLAHSIRGYRSRTHLALASPGLLLRSEGRGKPVVPAGATNLLGMLGVVLGALELSDAIQEGQMPTPTRVVVPLGTGGTAIGLSVGLGLAGLDCSVHAVAVVERSLSSRRRMRRMQRRLCAFLRANGVELRPVPIKVDRSQLGPSYGWSTQASLDACRVGQEAGLPMEPIYSGKALAALAPGGKADRALLWCTPARSRPPSSLKLERLPPWMSRRLQSQGWTDSEGTLRDLAQTPPSPLTRRLVLGGVTAMAGLALGSRLFVYPDGTWLPRAFGAHQGLVLEHVVRTILGPGLDAELVSSVAQRIDAYVAGMPKAKRMEITGLLHLIEQGPFLLSGRTSRFSRMSPEAQNAFLQGLRRRGGLMALASRGLRDLVYVGYYQQPQSWPELGYGGPLLTAPAPSLQSAPGVPQDSLRRPPPPWVTL